MAHRVDFNVKTTPAAQCEIVNAIIPAALGQWLYYCYNAEFLFHPFNETRNVSEMMTFHAEERRDAMLTYVIDLYAGDLQKHKSGVSIDDAWLDKTGYYALGRPDPDNHNHPKERQLDFLEGCIGALKSTSRRTVARLTGYRFSARKRIWNCGRTTRLTTKNTTPMPALGTTTRQRLWFRSELPRR